MCPRFAVQDLPYELLADSVLTRYIFQRPSLVLRAAYLHDLYGRELGCANGLAPTIVVMDSTPFRNHVARVVGLCTDEDVCGIAAYVPVADMARTHAGGDGAVD